MTCLNLVNFGCKLFSNVIFPFLSFKHKYISRYKVKKEFDGLSLLEVEIETGRTHQIRVHMAAIDHPVVGDNTYGVGSYNRRFKEKYGLKRQFLHAAKLEFKDLEGKKKKIVVDLPEDLKNVLSKL